MKQPLQNHTLLYRGFSFVDLASTCIRGFEPERTLPDDVIRSVGVIDHVADGQHRLRFFLSFSTTVQEAIWYATKNGKKWGFLAQVSLGHIVSRQSMTGSPFLYFSDDGCEWVDPRNTLIDRRSAKGLQTGVAQYQDQQRRDFQPDFRGEWQQYYEDEYNPLASMLKTRDNATRDDEILLAKGTVRPQRLWLVSPSGGRLRIPYRRLGSLLGRLCSGLVCCNQSGRRAR